VKTASEMTYTVSSGALNSTQTKPNVQLGYAVWVLAATQIEYQKNLEVKLKYNPIGLQLATPSEKATTKLILLWAILPNAQG